MPFSYLNWYRTTLCTPFGPQIPLMSTFWLKNTPSVNLLAKKYLYF